MGLTIHYGLQTSLTGVDEIRKLLESVRQKAQELPFKEVGDLLEFQDEETDYRTTSQEDRACWLKMQAGAHFQEDGEYVSVKPLHIIGFATLPGEGCEAANFGLCRYPATIAAAGRDSRDVQTNLIGWRWRSFCKTQYASDPAYGGTENFLRCHLGVVELLDFIQNTGQVQVEVHDEGAYWNHRDRGKLALEVGKWNEIMAAYAGAIKDGFNEDGLKIQSAIASFANFERLEAKGQARLQAQTDRERADLE